MYRSPVLLIVHFNHCHCWPYYQPGIYRRIINSNLFIGQLRSGQKTPIFVCQQRDSSLVELILL